MRNKAEIEQLIKDCEKAIKRHQHNLRNSYLSNDKINEIVKTIQMESKTIDVLSWVLQNDS